MIMEFSDTSVIPSSSPGINTIYGTEPETFTDKDTNKETQFRLVPIKFEIITKCRSASILIMTLATKRTLGNP